MDIFLKKSYRICKKSYKKVKKLKRLKNYNNGSPVLHACLLFKFLGILWIPWFPLRNATAVLPKVGLNCAYYSISNSVI